MPGLSREQQYEQDAVVLGELGRHLVRLDMPRVSVRLPRSLAERAVAAWERDEDSTVPEAEDFEQRAKHHRAATLALIGLSITNGGRWDEEGVEVELDPTFIGLAVDAADDLP
jgi:hypothetical protein